MNRIFNDMNNILTEFKNMSKLEDNKLGYFFSDNEFDIIPKDNSESIRTYPIAAYMDHLQYKFNAIFKPDGSILIDESSEIEINTCKTNMYLIYTNSHNINKTIVELNMDSDIVSRSKFSYDDINRIFDIKIDYFDFANFMKTINHNYITSILLIEDYLKSKRMQMQYGKNINGVRLYNQASLDSSNYNKVPLYFIKINMYYYNDLDYIISDISSILDNINEKLPSEIFLNLYNDNGDITIYGNYIWNVSESYSINSWAKVLFGNNKYLEEK